VDLRSQNTVCVARGVMLLKGCTATPILSFFTALSACCSLRCCVGFTVAAVGVLNTMSAALCDGKCTGASVVFVFALSRMALQACGWVGSLSHLILQARGKVCLVAGATAEVTSRPPLVGR
jgi:hypothetical protein